MMTPPAPVHTDGRPKRASSSRKGETVVSSTAVPSVCTTVEQVMTSEPIA